MELNNITGVPVIVLLCYLIIEGVKLIFGEREKLKALLPLISAGIGVIVSIVLFRFTPQIIPAESYIGAILMGIFSGLSATGSNQIWKQMKKLVTSKNNLEKDE